MQMSSFWRKSESEKSSGMVASRGVPSAPEDFSLALGGPLYQIYLRTRAARPPLDLLHRRIIAFPLICWLPLLLLSLAEGHALTGVHVPFLLDIETYARFLVALPLLLVAEVVVHKRISGLIQQFKVREIISRGGLGPIRRYCRLDNASEELNYCGSHTACAVRRYRTGYGGNT